MISKKYEGLTIKQTLEEKEYLLEFSIDYESQDIMVNSLNEGLLKVEKDNIYEVRLKANMLNDIANYAEKKFRENEQSKHRNRD